jgi:hypothetical protein
LFSSAAGLAAEPSPDLFGSCGAPDDVHRERAFEHRISRPRGRSLLQLRAAALAAPLALPRIQRPSSRIVPLKRIDRARRNDQAGQLVRLDRQQPSHSASACGAESVSMRTLRWF